MNRSRAWAGLVVCTWIVLAACGRPSVGSPAEMEAEMAAQVTASQAEVTSEPATKEASEIRPAWPSAGQAESATAGATGPDPVGVPTDATAEWRPTDSPTGEAVRGDASGAPLPVPASGQLGSDLAPGPLPGELPEPPPSAGIPGTIHVWQKWNNCGPSAAVMALSAFGTVVDQLEAAAHLKPDREDTNVTPEELAAYIRSQGFGAHVGYGGDREVVRRLVSVAAPVIAEQWIDVEGRGEMGHYRVVVGYDDQRSIVIADDSYYGARRTYGYSEFEDMWAPFLGAYVVVYREDQADLVRAALAPDLDPGAMWQRVLATASNRAQSDGRGLAWLALGEAKSRVGDYPGAALAFETAIQAGLPFRAFWYQFGYYRSLYALERYADLLAHADATIETMRGQNLEESHYWRGRALLALERRDEALAAFARALEFNPGYAEPMAALEGLAH